MGIDVTKLDAAVAKVDVLVRDPFALAKRNAGYTEEHARNARIQKDGRPVHEIARANGMTEADVYRLKGRDAKGNRI